MAYPVVLDANVLFGIWHTDLLLSMAVAGLYRPYWSPEILDEVQRNVVSKGATSEASIVRRIEHMNAARPDALTEVPAELVASMTNDAKDRHVLALAVLVGAPTIVTNNLKDFGSEHCAPFAVEAVDLDTFVLAQVDLRSDLVLEAIEGMASRRTNPEVTVDGVIERLRQDLPQAVERLLTG